MAVNSAAGTKIYIGSTNIPPNLEDLDDAAALLLFEADSYVEIGEVENLGEYGDESQDIAFASLGDSRTRHFKGTRDAGVLPLVVGADPDDEGQLACIEAERSNLDFNFKVVGNDAVTLGGDGSVDYFHGKMMSKRKNVGDVNTVVRQNFSVGINSRIVTREAT